MTRKDYEILAEALAYSHPSKSASYAIALVQWQRTIDQVIIHLQTVNPKYFDSHHFGRAITNHVMELNL